MSERRPIKWHIDPSELNPSTYCTICEVHRRLWRLVEQAVKPEDPVTASKLQALLAEGYDLGVRMDKKLREYKDNYDQDMLSKSRPE